MASQDNDERASENPLNSAVGVYNKTREGPKEMIIIPGFIYFLCVFFFQLFTLRRTLAQMFTGRVLRV